MKRNTSQRFADWAIKLRSRVQTDPFFKTRLELMLLYFAVGAVIFMFLGWFISSVRLEPVLELTNLQTSDIAQSAYQQYQQELFWRRLLLVAAFIISTYFLTEFSLRSIKKSMQIQQRFFGTVSHELRTPLAIMQNTAEVALRHPERLTQEKSEKVITSMLEEVNRMSSTVTFLLSLSSLSVQRRIPNMEDVALSEIAEKVFREQSERAASAGVTLHEHIAGQNMVHGNRTALAGLISNLLENAIRHTPTGGVVSLSISQEKRAVVLVVSDTGSGIKKKDLPYIFEPFYRGSSKTAVKEEGFGLGLSLVREVARLHRAPVRVSSDEGKGTTFSLRFPGL